MLAASSAWGWNPKDYENSDVLMRNGQYIALSGLAPIRWWGNAEMVDPSGRVGNAWCELWPFGSRPALTLCLSNVSQCWWGTPRRRPPDRFLFGLASQSMIAHVAQTVKPRAFAISLRDRYNRCLGTMRVVVMFKSPVSLLLFCSGGSVPRCALQGVDFGP